jgi:hypothetical protein
MAEVAQLEVGIIAKLDKFDLTLNQAQSQLKALSQAAGDASKTGIADFNVAMQEMRDYIKALKKEGLPDIVYKLGDDLNKVNPTLDQTNQLIKKFREQAGSASKNELPALNKEILKLETYASGLQKLGLPTDIPESSKRSTIALTSLNQVVQDLPFGFIGIQNNIPNLVQSFGTLVKTEGGVRKALISLGSTISGPVGLVAAVSLLTTGVTILVQKYGSLGNVLNAVFGIQSKFNEELKKANESYKDYNESKRTSEQITNQEILSVTSNITKVQALIDIITDQTKSYNERNSALITLQGINKDYFGNLGIEKTALEDLTKAGYDYIDYIKQAALTKGFENEITNTSVELAKQIDILNTLKEERDDINRRPAKIIGKADTPDLRPLNAANQRVNEQDKIVNKLRKNLELFNTELRNSIIEENKLKAPIDAANEAFKNQQEAIKNAEKNATQLSKIQEDRFKREDDAFKVLRDAYVATLNDRNQELYKAQEDYEDKRSTLLRANNNDFVSIENELRIKIQDINDKYDKIGIENAKKTANERLKLQEELGKSARNQFESTFIDLKTAKDRLKVQEEIGKLGRDQFESTFIAKKGKSEQEENAKALENSYLSVGRAIFNNVINPLNELFDVILSKGEKSWQDFTNVVLDSLKKLLIKLAAAAAIAVILSAISGGASNSAKGGVGFLKAFGSILGVNLGGKVANPGFGGVNPGGMAMAGSVNLVLRGQDLVGSINRTNSQLSRIG